MKYAIHNTTPKNTAQSRVNCSVCKRKGSSVLAYTLDENLRVIDVRLLCNACRTRMHYSIFHQARGEMMST
ncbi:MAG: hypothetical protein M0R37_13460 [Bacteroidales bacterium]|nr:hypothetical protein [Bacteroidales bacterium]